MSYTVSEITDRIQRALESSIEDSWVEGEISNFRPAASGHWYFALKDERAMISVVMFRQAAASVAFQPREGDLIRVYGRVGVYPQRGVYQLVVRSMQRAGSGAILALLEQRKLALAAEGLFDQSKKRPLPASPRRIVVITSPTGAAIRDILQVLQRRRAPVHVRILPALVQGEDAAAAVSAQIERANRLQLGEIIVVTRGGGSLEDLLPFSEERLVRAVRASAIPIISAVGHETDVSLCDLAADLRAPTPSAAAEIVCAEGRQMHERVVSAFQRIRREYESHLRDARRRWSRYSSAELTYRYRNYVQPWYQRVDEALQRLRVTTERRMVGYRARLAIAQERIAASSPQAVLERGYAIVRSAEGRTIRTRAEEIGPTESLLLQFADGVRGARAVDEGR